MALWRLVLIAAVVLAGGSARGPPFTSTKAPTETVRNYEVYTPVLHNQVLVKGQLQSFDVEVSSYLIHLELNSNLVSPRFTSHHYDKDGTTIVRKGHVNCFYHGMVRGHPEWHVVMSACNGLQGSFGELGAVNNYYHLEPLDPANTTLEQPHAVYSAAEYSVREESCGVPEHAQSPSKGHFSSAIPHDIHVDTNRVRRLVNGFYIVEWAMINDLAQFQLFENLEATVMRALEIANFVDSLFQTLSVRVVVVRMITWNNGNQITIPGSGDSDAILNNLRDFEPQITGVHDSTMLITGVDLEGNTVGRAFIGTMCRGQVSVGVSQDSQRPLDSVGSTAAHELGHIFRMEHDDGRGCSCDDPSGNCIMSAVSGRPSPTVWSSCSRSDIADGFTEDNLNSCLDNEPLVTVADPMCGNGIREGEEICDCGLPEECIDPCCNATSCTLRAGAQCASGDCCTRGCQYQALGTVCRSATQQCDIAEFCMGDSSSCPTDLHLQDGSPCNGGSDFCYTGVCENLDAQCLRFFGSSAGIPQCFDNNIAGEGSGNCGSSQGNFIGCAPEDARCGQLQCASGNFMRSGANGFLRIFTEFVRNSDGDFEECMSFTSESDSDTLSPGLVADGTKCGPTSICVFQRCTQISSLQFVEPCPVGSNNLTCSGTGVCNNMNECSCTPGASGSSCGGATGGGGGGNAGAIAGAIVGVILGIALAAGVAVGVVFVVRKFRTSKGDKGYRPTPRHHTPTSTANTRSNGYRPPAYVQPHSSPQYDPQPPPRPSAPHIVPSATRPPPPIQSTPRSRPPPPPPGGVPPARVAPPKPPPPSKPIPPAPPGKAAAPNKPSPAPKPHPGKLGQQWPPPGANTSAEKPLPSKKPVFPPRK